jgi:hypothetical protein
MQQATDGLFVENKADERRHTPDYIVHFILLSLFVLFASGKFTEVIELHFDVDIVLYFIIVIIKHKKYKHNVMFILSMV